MAVVTEAFDIPMDIMTKLATGCKTEWNMSKMWRTF